MAADQSATFTAVDLSRLPAPIVVQQISYEDILADLIDGVRALMPDFDATVESDPIVKLVQAFAYRETLLRAQNNDAARAVMVAYAVGADLDNLAALFGVTRLMLDPGDPERGIDPAFESDDDFRSRLVLSPEGYSVAGPEGAYIYHARSADGDVLDASAISPAPGQVLVTVLSRTGDGTAPPDLIARVAAHVSDETRRPLTDQVTVQGARIVPYAIDATVTTFAGPDGTIVMAEARRRLDAYVVKVHRLGLDVTRAGIIAALFAEGVQNVTLAAPAADIILDRTQASWCTGINVAHAGTGE